MLSLKQQFKEVLTEIPKALLRSAYGLSVDEEKQVDKISELTGIEKFKVVMWRSKQRLRLPWIDTLYFAYRFERLPTEDETIQIYQYGLGLFVRLKKLNKI